jgi:hypothetical protein
MAGREKGLALATAPGGTWVQVERAALERWSKLAVINPRASSVLLTLISQVGRNNAIIASHANLARACGCSVSTLKRSISVLMKENWIEIRQIGPTGTACAYIINDRVAWNGNRDGIRYSLFSATVLISDDEQPDKDKLGVQEPLTPIPSLYPGERQLPTGPGLPPPYEPALPGMEMDLPSLEKSTDDR